MVEELIRSIKSNDINKIKILYNNLEEIIDIARENEVLEIKVEYFIDNLFNDIIKKFNKLSNKKYEIEVNNLQEFLILLIENKINLDYKVKVGENYDYKWIL